MIVKFAPSGHSFKSLADYLQHDPKAQSAERVGWTHTLNLAHDHVASAVDQMFWTFQNRDLLKAEAGVRPGGAKLEKPVRHISLAWHPSERPTREAMIAAAEAFLRHLGAHEHQAILFSHTDKPHHHVHIMLNAVHPERGTALKESFSYRQAQAWSLAYEIEKGIVYCAERLKPPGEREASPPRAVWLLLQQSMQAHMRAETARLIEAPDARDMQVGAERLDWKTLKELQREERQAFFEGGRRAYRDTQKAVYREVKKELRPEWAKVYASQRDGTVPAVAAAMKADLLARQAEIIEQRRDDACAALRVERDAAYRVLLDRHIAQRAALHSQHERSLAPAAMLRTLADAGEAPPSLPLPDFERHDTDPAERRARQSAPEHPQGWTQRAGMVAQQRSALRWLDRVAERARAHPRWQQSEPGKAALDRLYGAKAPRVAHDLGPAKDKRGMEFGPD